MREKLGTIIAGVCVLMAGLALWILLSGIKPPPHAAGAVMESPHVSSNAVPASTTNLISYIQQAKEDFRAGTLVQPRDPFFFGLDRVSWLQWHILGTVGQPAWEVLASLLYVLMAFYVAKLLDLFINSKLKKWAARTRSELDDILLNLLHGPTTLLTFVVLLHYGLALSSLFSLALKLLVAFSLTYLLLNTVDLSLAYWKRRTAEGGVDKAFDDMLLPIIRKSAKAFIILVAVLLTSDNLGLSITSVLASLSIGGLALGLAAQDTLANIFGAVSVFVDKPFRIGDRIKIEQVDGVVESIGLRSTRVRNGEGYLVAIPNKIVGSATITNISRRPAIRTELNLGFARQMPVEKLRRALEIIREVYAAHPLVGDVEIVFNNFTDTSLNVNVAYLYKATVWKDYIAAAQQLNLTLKERLDKEGITLATPVREVFIRTSLPVQPLQT